MSAGMRATICRPLPGTRTPRLLWTRDQLSVSTRVKWLTMNTKYYTRRQINLYRHFSWNFARTIFESPAELRIEWKIGEKYAIQVNVTTAIVGFYFCQWKQSKSINQYYWHLFYYLFVLILLVTICSSRVTWHPERTIHLIQKCASVGESAICSICA